MFIITNRLFSEINQKEQDMINPYKVIKEIGFERLAGSEGEKKAIQILTSHLKDLDVNYKLENFKLVSFNPGEATITCGDRKFPARPYGLNKNCRITGELVYLDNPVTIEANKGAYKNKIVISYGASRRLASILLEGNVAAFISISKPGREVSSSSHRQNSFKEGYVPSMTIKHEFAEKLIRFSGKIVEIDLKQEVKEVKAHNIVVDIKGKDFDDNLTLACGHYDTVAHSAGSSDNGGGTVSLLKVIEYFQKNKPLRDLRIIFFSGEELGLLGSQAFVEKHKEELKKRAGFVVNIDVSGDPVGIDVLAVTGTKEILGYCDGLCREVGITMKTNLGIYSSDSMPFTKYEIPSANISRFGGKANLFIHTEDDIPKYVNKPGLDNTITSSITILDRILNAKVYPIQKEIDGSLREKIEKYLYNLTYEDPKLEWTPKFKK